MKSSSDHTPPNDEAIEAMAASWLVQQEEGLTPAQAAEFARWRNSDPKHEAAVVVLEETSGILSQMPFVREKLTPANAVESAPAATIVRFPFPRALKIAVALAACIAVAFIAWRLQPAGEENVFTNTYATTADGYLRVSLPDNSVLELNAGTEVRVRFTPRERRIALDRGEAHFTVTKNPARPFVVGAGNVAVRAVGTAFNVRLADASIEVLVTEGRVQVGKSNLMRTSGTSEVADFFTTDLPVLVAGQRVTVAKDTSPRTPTSKVAALDPEAVRAALAWQAPRLVFLDTPLTEVVQQFNRHNRVQLVLDDAELGARPVGGTFRADHVETFVRLLETSGDIAVERPGADRIILRKVTAAPASR